MLSNVTARPQRSQRPPKSTSVYTVDQENVSATLKFLIRDRDADGTQLSGADGPV